MSNKRASLEENSPLDHLFNPTVTPRQAPAGPPAAPRQRPSAAPKKTTRRTKKAAPLSPAADGALRQTTIMVYDAQLDWLDEAVYRARRSGNKKVAKAGIIRALIDLVRDREVDLQGAYDDAAVRARLADALGL